MHKILGLFFVLSLLNSCNKKEEVYMKAIDGSWNQKTSQKFIFEVKDAPNAKNMIFVVRNNDEYPYSNLRLIVDLEDLKTRKKQTDTLNYILAKPDGSWIGKGFGETKEALFQYRLGYHFPENGKYAVEIKQAMRKNMLPGIEDIGLKIENTKP